MRAPAVAFLTLALTLLAMPALAQPDLRSMSGLPLPSPDLPDGTLSVRVVRGGITNNVAGVAVELHGAGDVRRAKTGTDGRAQFTGIPAGSRVHAVAIVDGTRLESHEFDMPPKGGVRTLLAAMGDAGAEGESPAGTAPPPALPGASSNTGLTLGGNSRVAMEFADDELQVFYLLDIVNPTGKAIAPPSALIFDMPDGAEGTTVLDGSTKQANAKGNRVTVAGPFPPGTTPLQIAYRLDDVGAARTIEQTFPLPLGMVVFAVQKAGDMQVSSPQANRTQEAPIESTMFVMGIGPGLAAGQPLQIRLSGVPHHSRVPAYAALTIAFVIFGIAAWASLTPASARDRRQLEHRRDEGLAALASLEREHQSGAIREQQYAARRTALVAALEQVYAALDAAGDGPDRQNAPA